MFLWWIVKSKDSLLNYQEIVFTGEDQVIRVDDESLAWGQQVLQGLDLGSMGDFAKAQKICSYLHDHFAYNFQRRTRFSEIIQKKGGNCVSHALMGIFLLRLSGLPAKFAHEVHLTKQYRLISLYVGIWAKRENDGINSFWHNDHVWVWFRNGETWEPFDSALDVCGFDPFYRKRFFQQQALSEGFAQKWTGPPFVIWQGTGDGLVGMKNITSAIIHPESMNGLAHQEGWQELVDLFKNWRQADFHKEYLPEHHLRRVRSMSIRWFKRGG